ncbi:lytic transglycosylase domain-containing protein [Asticcacaulis sp. BYS171W]|uniref:Lytic transglycosylase domain-containing protein n=1 Tax=Asticcacaulis aquaticus TaxID=2984212 RepID=A0ABT5HRR8_9CAUL|nr:lytic transglycosylase domain-containing protein [Asticcacaulis aquaticus]MDC7682146.1 lytic transglycosylase domain-containing protein [Asticcacaulis aquaticus]
MIRKSIVRPVSIGIILGLAPLTNQSVHAVERRAKWEDCKLQSSVRFGVPLVWIDAVMAAESGGKTHLNGQPITSSAGAMGLMQLMPRTYADLRETYGLGPDPHDPCDNITAGTAYLRAMWNRFGYPGLFAAYNAGPTRYEAYLRGRPLPLETRLYLKKVIRSEPTLASGLAIFVRSTANEAIPKVGELFVPLADPQGREGGP